MKRGKLQSGFEQQLIAAAKAKTIKDFLMYSLIYNDDRLLIYLNNYFSQMNKYGKGEFFLKDSWEEEKKENKLRNKKSNKSIEKNKQKNKTQQIDPEQISFDNNIAKKWLNQFKKQGGVADSLKFPPINNDKKDIVSSMANRLSHLEITCHNQRSQIKENLRKIQKLKQENEWLSQANKDAAQSYSKNQKLAKQNEELKTKIQIMTNVLKQYGLKWVNQKLEGKFNANQLKQDIKQTPYNYKLPAQISISLISKRIQQLNFTLQEEGNHNQVYKEKDGIHKLKQVEPLMIGFYKDGLVIEGHPFWKYKSKDAKKVLADLMDGYFPYILKNKYPNGVFLKILDKLDNEYEVKRESIKNCLSMEQQRLQPISKDQFLNKLPKQIIKDGKIIKIRQGIAQKFKRNNSVNLSIQYPQKQRIENDNIIILTKVQKQLDQNKIEQKNICTLKIRSLSGSKIMIVKMLPTDKIIDVENEIKYKIKGNFRLQSNYPKRQFTMLEKQNLYNLGLTPNALLQIIK